MAAFGSGDGAGRAVGAAAGDGLPPLGGLPLVLSSAGDGLGAGGAATSGFLAFGAGFALDAFDGAGAFGAGFGFGATFSLGASTVGGRLGHLRR